MEDNVQKHLQALIVLYAKHLPDKIKNIEDQWQNQLNQWDPIQLKKFHRDVHSLSGSAGTYGYSELSKAARQMEIYLMTLLDTTVITDEKKDKVTDLLEQLKSAFAHPKP